MSRARPPRPSVQNRAHTHVSEEQLTQALRARGLKVTVQRLALLQYLEKSGEPRTIEEAAQALADTANLVTIYRAVERLLDVGLIEATLGSRGDRLIEYQAHHHHHVSCTTCGFRTQLAAPRIERALSAAQSDVPGFRSVERHTVELFGTCVQCAP